MKNKRIRLATKAYSAFKILKSNTLNKRSADLQSIGDYSLSLLMIWIEIEALLKLLRYYDKISDEYPKDLKFINKNWRILKHIYNADNKKYDLILGKNSNSLRSIRNDIVHNGLSINKIVHDKYFETAKWIRSMLFNQLQPQEVFLSRRRRLKM